MLPAVAAGRLPRPPSRPAGARACPSPPPRSALDPTSPSTQDLPSPPDAGVDAGQPDLDPLQDAEAGPAAGFAAATLAELSKVVWPSRQQLFSESLAVILMVSLSAAAIAAVGRFYGWLSSLVFR